MGDLARIVRWQPARGGGDPSGAVLGGRLKGHDDGPAVLTMAWTGARYVPWMRPNRTTWAIGRAAPGTPRASAGQATEAGPIRTNHGPFGLKIFSERTVVHRTVSRDRSPQGRRGER